MPKFTAAKIARRVVYFSLWIFTAIAVLGTAYYFIHSSRISPPLPKLHPVDNTFHQIRNLAAKYYAENGTYPYSYGLVNPEFAGAYKTGERDSHIFQTTPYTQMLRLHGNPDFNDTFASGYDTDGDGDISILEFLPLGVQEKHNGAYSFPAALYVPGDISPEIQEELARMHKAHQRPYVFLSVNKEQAQLAHAYWVRKGDFLAETWDWEDPDLEQVTIPAASMNAFVVISTGSGQSTCGILKPPSNPKQPLDLAELYHVATLRAFFLATRDLDEDGIPDLGYQGRKARSHTYTVNGFTCNNALPDGCPHGPYVFSYGWN